MKIQSLSIVVPASCPNKCKFCVSRMHENRYINQIENNWLYKDLYKKDYKDRLAFARDNGCNTVMLTGAGEPILNLKFISNFAEWNSQIDQPFRWIELQTSGVTLDETLLQSLRMKSGVSTISLSLSSIFDDDKNADYNGTPERLKVNIKQLCSAIKKNDFCLRLSLNMTDAYNNRVSELFERTKELAADQITFRILYTGQNTEINSWINEHRIDPFTLKTLRNVIMNKGKPLEKLPFGATRYSLQNMSVVLDDDCMSTATDKDAVKYLILQPNCKLYTKWDDPGSLLF